MSSLRALVVDDNALNIELVRFLLESDGFEVDSALDADDALRAIGAHVPDVILMDVQLPGVDGLTLTRRIKSDAALQPIAIVAFTAYAMKGDEAKMRAAGCDGYLSKPIDVATFVASVREVMRSAREAASGAQTHVVR